jgi:hypothetical protein
MENQHATLRTPSLRSVRGRNLTKIERSVLNFMCFTHTPTEQILEELDKMQLMTQLASGDIQPIRLISRKTISNIKGMFNRLDRLEEEFEEAGENASQSQADGAIVAQAARAILLAGGSLSGASFNALFIP